jgi:hypothetical protein
MFRAVCTVIVVSSLMAGLFRLGQKSPPGGDVTKHVAVPAAMDMQHDVVDKLQAAGWPPNAATAVAHVNEERFRWLHEVARESLDRELRAFATLHPSGRMAVLLERHPQTAGLLLLARDPVALADGILACSDEADQIRLIGSFVKYTEPAEVTQWAESVAKHGRCIAGLLHRCQAWPVDAVFVYPRADLAVAATYDLWLDKIFEPGNLPARDEEMLSLMEFVMGNGNEIRRRMTQYPAFREMFLDSAWPTFARCVRREADMQKARCPWDMFNNSGHVWDLLMRPDGEALFQRAGLLAADLLYGNDAVDPALREKTAQLLLLGNLELVDASFTAPFSRHPQFRRLILTRNLSDDQILAACKKLRDEQEGYNTLLGTWDGLSDQALGEDIGPPPDGLRTWVPGYGVYYAGKKLFQGRDLGWIDAIAVGGDVVTIATLGGSKVLSESGKQAAKAGLKAKLRDEAVKDLAALSSREIAEQASEKQLTSLIAHHALKSLPSELGEALLKTGVVDMTSVLHGAFKIMSRFGIGRESFKKLTGLEARVFLRKDAKVFVNLPSAIAGNNPYARFLNETSINGAVEEVMRTQVAKEGLQKGLQLVSETKERWQEHLACWWSGLATAAFDQSIKQP